MSGLPGVQAAWGLKTVAARRICGNMLGWLCCSCRLKMQQMGGPPSMMMSGCHSLGATCKSPAEGPACHTGDRILVLDRQTAQAGESHRRLCCWDSAGLSGAHTALLGCPAGLLMAQTAAMGYPAGLLVAGTAVMGYAGKETAHMLQLLACTKDQQHLSGCPSWNCRQWVPRRVDPASTVMAGMRSHDLLECLARCPAWQVEQGAASGAAVVLAETLAHPGPVQAHPAMKWRAWAGLHHIPLPGQQASVCTPAAPLFPHTDAHMWYRSGGCACIIWIEKNKGTPQICT